MEDQLPDMSRNEGNSSFPGIFVLPTEPYYLCHVESHFCEVQNYGTNFFAGQSYLYENLAGAKIVANVFNILFILDYSRVDMISIDIFNE
jgi:hypothetical protein